MPRNGALILSEVGVPVLTVVCEPCGRRDRYDVERLTRQYGWDAKLTDLLAELTADCPKRGSSPKGSVSVYDRCKAVFAAGKGRAKGAQNFQRSAGSLSITSRSTFSCSGVRSVLSRSIRRLAHPPIMVSNLSSSDLWFAPSCLVLFTEALVIG